MKMKPIIASVALLAGCRYASPGHSSSPQVFLQGNIRITAPVLDVSPSGRLFNDGGTRWITLSDADGRSIEVYVDHRLRIDAKGDISRVPEQFYLNAYPGESNSVPVVDQELFKAIVMKGVQYQL